MANFVHQEPSGNQNRKPCQDIVPPGVVSFVRKDVAIRLEMENVLAVQRMQDYLAQHLQEHVTLAALARDCGYSPFYCTRLFRDLTGKTPFEYLRMLRLTQAALRLRGGGVRVLDTALDFMFDSHEGFTRAFAREFGLTPMRYSKNPSPIRLFLPQPILSYYLYLQRGAQPMETKPDNGTVFVQVVDRPARKLIVRRSQKAEDYFAYCNEVGCDVWGMLCSVREALYEPIGIWLPPKLISPGTSPYVQGVEVPANYAGDVPEGYELLDLEPCSMMVFQGPEFNDQDNSFCDAIERIQRAIAAYQPSIYGYAWADEDYPRFQLEPQGWRGYIEARPVRKLP